MRYFSPFDVAWAAPLEPQKQLREEEARRLESQAAWEARQALEEARAKVLLVGPASFQRLLVQGWSRSRGAL